MAAAKAAMNLSASPSLTVAWMRRPKRSFGFVSLEVTSLRMGFSAASWAGRSVAEKASTAAKRRVFIGSVGWGGLGGASRRGGTAFWGKGKAPSSNNQVPKKLQDPGTK